MNLKEEVLKILKNNKDKLVSGSNIATKLNISRMYVNKIVKQLIDDGYEIVINKRVGYTYYNDNRVLDKARILDKLDNSDIYDIDILERIDSTNNFVKEKFNRNSDIIPVCIAEEQLAGRGKKGRSFLSTKGKGIYMSFLFKPNFDVEYGKRITTCVCVAVAKSLEEAIKQEVKIKWVNDIYLNNKKICGIITTGSTNLETNMFDYVIVGIGINLYHQDFPDEISMIASTVEDETKVIVNINTLVSSILNNVFKELKNIENNNYIVDYRKRLLMKSQEVEIKYIDHSEIVKIIDVDEDGELIVEYENEQKKVYSGEIVRMVISHE